MQTTEFQTPRRRIDEADNGIRTKIRLRCAAEFAEVKAIDALMTSDCVVSEEAWKVIVVSAPQIVEAELIRAELKSAIVVP